jgi:hypothetical protein
METLFHTLAQEGPRRWSGWDAGLFAQTGRGPARALARSLDGEAHAEQVLTAYLRLVQEAIGLGYLGAGPDPGNFLTHCLLRVVPDKLASVPAPERLAVLAKVWNLGEGLLREPAWVDRYVVACAAQLTDLADLEAFLVRVLEPALVPVRAALWQGLLHVDVLDLRPVLDEFLPGEMHLAAPAVLCVHDRRLVGVHVGLFLRPERKSAFLGLTPCLRQYAEEAPPGKLEDGRLTVGAATAELPLLGRGHRHVRTRSGFAVASAVDSQRLWVVESA